MPDKKKNQEIIDDPIEVRRNKRQALIDAGKMPYGHRFDFSAHAAELQEKYTDIKKGEITKDAVEIAGRIMAKRGQGKLTFLEIYDNGTDIQILCRINDLGEGEYEHVKDLDIGDWIAVSGFMMRTRRGALSVLAKKVELMSKALRPLPEKFHGLEDKELRYRQRYVDLIVNADVRDTFEKRSKIVQAIRRYMEQRGYFEFETPFLHHTVGGANAEPFVTRHNALESEFYLRIATELYLKRLIVAGFDRVYEIGRQFRNEGMDHYHNPEFTTLEAYEAFSGLEDMMELCRELFQVCSMAANGRLQITYQGKEIDLSGDWKVATMCDLATKYAAEPVNMDLSLEELRIIAKKNEIHYDKVWGKGKLVAEIFDELASQKLVQPTFVTEHPLDVSPLAKKLPENPELTERFELFICGHEYANAFNELNDPVDQAERFNRQLEAKDLGDKEAMGYDADFIRALEYG
ncbi:MAG: lysine--tRNA ligase, partial [Eggerthellaceae bacterium]|nr:lysine--tRNA ligase [Eggerthellaceae bacterium]